MSWIAPLHEARAAGKTGAVLSFNVSDRVLNGKTATGLRYFLASVFAEAYQYQTGYFSLVAGFQELNPPAATAKRTSAASPFRELIQQENPLLVLRALDPILKNPQTPVLILLDYADHLAPASANSGGFGGPQEQHALIEILHEWSLDDDIRQAGHFIILLTRDNGLHPLLAHESGFAQIRVGLPEASEREQFAQFLNERLLSASASHPALAQGLTFQQFAHLTSGLRLRDIEGLFRHSLASGTPITASDIRIRKREAIEQLAHGLVEVIEPTQGFESVGGCVAAKQYFSALKPLWQQGHESLPQGILLAGVPGSGKSWLVKALAKELQTPCLALRNVREQWVGASERNMERVLDVIQSLAPCLFWTDEVDQQVGGDRGANAGAGDSGVNQRIFGRLLEFFGDSSVRGKVLWIATSNRPDLLDLALRDRFSVKIPFLHPSRSERAELMPLLVAQVGRELEAEADIDPIAASMALNGLSARALQEIIVWAGTLADRRQGRPGSRIAQSDLRHAIADYKPSYDPGEHEFIALIALQMASFHSLLPWNDLSVERGQASLRERPAYVADLIDDTGRLQTEALERRIQELRWARQRGV